MTYDPNQPRNTNGRFARMGRSETEVVFEHTIDSQDLDLAHALAWSKAQRVKDTQLVKSLQADYDTTEMGMLELRRRKAYDMMDADERLEAAESHVRGTVARPEGDWTPEPLRGHEGLPWDDVEDYDRLDEGTRRNMVAHSVQWMSRLTPDEVEAVAWMTSNGSHVAWCLINDEKSNWMWDEEAMPTAEVQKRLDDYFSALDKAPEQDAPAVIYRGLNDDNEDGAGSTFPTFEVGDRYLSPGPECCTVSRSIAWSHTSTKAPRVLEIETRTIASTACMSAYGLVRLRR